MGPDLELKGRSDISREASSKEPVGLSKELENNHMKCSSNFEDKNLDKQVETVNILENMESGDIQFTEAEKTDPDLTESSSSFGSTVSGDGNGAFSSDAEVDSDSLSALPFDGYSELFWMRKKKVTSDWRKYIGPLVWRCKWAELQIKKFEFQAQKYDKEIAELNKSKQLKNCTFEDVSSKSLLFSAQSRRREVMKRNKRKRVEDTDDVASYMSRHNLFSYFENKRLAADAAFADGNLGSQVACVEKTSNGANDIGDEESLNLEFKDGDSLEQMFWKIGLMQWQVNQMKTRVHKVLSTKASKFNSTKNLSLLVSYDNTLKSSAQNQGSLLKNDDVVAVAPSSISVPVVRDCDNKLGDVVMPESTASVHDTMKSTVSPALGGLSRNPSGGILMYNRRAKKDPNKSNVANNNIEAVQMTNDEEQRESSIAPKIRSISEMTLAFNTGINNNNNKRKRARRKAGPGKWNR